jgi:hypothetical protein
MATIMLEVEKGWRYPYNQSATPGTASWRTKMEVLWQYLHRDMRDARKQRQSLYPETWHKHVQRVVPFVWRVAREMASMKRARSFVDPVTGEGLPDFAVRIINRIYADSGVDAAMMAAYGQLVTLNQATVWCFPRGAGLRVVTMPPHEQAVELVDPMAYREDDVDAWRVLVPVAQQPVSGAVRYATARFTATELTWLEDFAQDFPAPFGGVNVCETIPCVFLRGGDTEPGAWWCYAPDDLLDAQRAINHDLTDIGHIARLQGYSQMYVAGLSPGEAESIKVGPEQLTALSDPTARMDFARAQPDLAGYANQIEQYMRAVISASTRAKSSGQVIFTLRSLPGTMATGCPKASSREASSVTAPARAAWAARSASNRKACGVWARKSPPRGTVASITPPATRFSVSATGWAGMAPV